MNDGKSNEVSAADASFAPPPLPPVEPPSASFIMQLFMIPLLIVTIIVFVWLGINWLARSGGDPHQLADGIERLNHASWQKALTLANYLQDPHHDELRHDKQLAQRLADLLEHELEEGRADEQRVWLRLYLARALGEFELPVGLDVLSRAAVEEKQPADIDVRRAALQGIGMLTENLGAEAIRTHAAVDEALITAARSRAVDRTSQARTRLRSTAAFVMGLVGNPSAKDGLLELLDDSSLDVRYNAAIALARQGDARSATTLLAMFDPQLDLLEDETASKLDKEVKEQWLIIKRNQILTNAVRATGQLVQQNPEVDREPFRDRISQLIETSEAPPQLRTEAKEVMRLLDVSLTS